MGTRHFTRMYPAHEADSPFLSPCSPQRCISGWSAQHEYVASIIGSRFLAHSFLAMIVVSQLSSVALLFPWASQTRRAAIISAGVCCALACSIVVQPIVYNQLDNVESQLPILTRDSQGHRPGPPNHASAHVAE